MAKKIVEIKIDESVKGQQRITNSSDVVDAIKETRDAIISNAGDKGDINKKALEDALISAVTKSVEKASKSDKPTDHEDLRNILKHSIHKAREAVVDSSGSKVLSDKRFEKIFTALEDRLADAIVSAASKAIDAVKSKSTTQAFSDQEIKSYAKEVHSSYNNVMKHLEALRDPAKGAAVSRAYETRDPEVIRKTVTDVVKRSDPRDLDYGVGAALNKFRADVKMLEEATRGSATSFAEAVTEADRLTASLGNLTDAVDDLSSGVAKVTSSLEQLDNQAKVDKTTTKPKQQITQTKPPAAKDKQSDGLVDAASELKSAAKDVSDAAKKLGDSVASVSQPPEVLRTTTPTTAATSTTQAPPPRSSVPELPKPPIHTKLETESYLNTFRFKDQPILPTKGKYKVGADLSHIKVSTTKDIYKGIEERATELSNSLDELQEHILTTIDKSLKKSGKSNSWAIVKDHGQDVIKDKSSIFELTTNSNRREGGKQWRMDMLNTAAAKRELRNLTKDHKRNYDDLSPKQLLDNLVKAKVDDLSNPEVVTFDNKKERVSKWIKSTSETNIMDTLGTGLDQRRKKKMIEIKRRYKGQAEVSKDMSNDVMNEVIGAIEADLEDIYKQTYAKTEAERWIRESKDSNTLIRSVAIPAARLTKQGNMVFETGSGSKRGIGSFGVYKTGFESMYEMLRDRSLESGDRGFQSKVKDFSDEIKALGMRPDAGVARLKADKVSRDMIKKLFETDRDGTQTPFIMDTYKQAAVSVGANLKKKGAISSVSDYVANVEKEINTTDLSKGIDTFMDAMDKIGVSAYDFVKSLESVDFQDVYKIMHKVVSGYGSERPLEKLGSEPNYSGTYRDFEKALKQVEQVMPLAEDSRPRSGKHRESTVHMLSMTSDMYDYGTGLNPETQKDLIRALNSRMAKMSDEMKLLEGETHPLVKQRLSRLPNQVSTLSSEGLPDSQIGSVKEHKIGSGYSKTRKDEEYTEGAEYLKALNAVSIKMYNDSLKSEAPGAQIQSARNISLVPNAYSGPEFPTLRSEKERAVIESGKYGTTGYGYNVTAELRHTANTFEDQMVISGKLADAITTITKTLVLPAAGGRRRGKSTDASSSYGVTDAEANGVPLKDFGANVDTAVNEIIRVMGKPVKHDTRADRALVEAVEKQISIVRSEPVEVQAVTIAETILNHLGRKFTTRYGSKGVSIAAEQHQDPLEAGNTFGKLMSAYGNKGIKIATDRERAGIGTAITPKSMGQLISEVITNKSDSLVAAGMDRPTIASLASEVAKAGNKPFIDTFKDTRFVSEDEAAKNIATFDKVATVLDKLSVKLDKDISQKASLYNIGSIKSLYTRSFENVPEHQRQSLGVGMYEEKPIDIRISAYGAAKRGLQTEVFESMMNNMSGGTDATTLKDNFDPKSFKELFGEEPSSKNGTGTPGSMNVYSEALGFKSSKGTVGGLGTADRQKAFEDLKEELTEKYAKDIIKRHTQGLTKGSKDYKSAVESLKSTAEYREAEQRAASVAALENQFSGYSDVITETGEHIRSLVGQKFVSIVEEPGETKGRSRTEIEAGTKGTNLNLPAYAAVETIYGKDSAIMREINDRVGSLRAEKSKEVMTALRMADRSEPNKEFVDSVMRSLPTESLSDINMFNAGTGYFEDGDRTLKNTVMDMSRFPTQFKVNIPKTGGFKHKPYQEAETDEFYIPSGILRDVYPEPKIAGEYGPTGSARRLQRVIEAAQQAQKAIKDPESGMHSTTIEEVFVEEVAKLLKEANSLGHTKDAKGKMLPEEQARLKEITEALYGALSPSSSPSGALAYKKDGSEVENFGIKRDQLMKRFSKAKSQGKTPDGGAYARELAMYAGELLIGISKDSKEQIDDYLNNKTLLEDSSVTFENSKVVQDLYNKHKKKIDQQLGGETSGDKKVDLYNALKKHTEFKTPTGTNLEKYKAKGAIHKAISEDYIQGRDNHDASFGLLSRLNVGTDDTGNPITAKDIAVERNIGRKTASLEDAKTIYYESLISSTLGKKGAVEDVMFHKTVPSVMAKAVSATVDKRDDLRKFQEQLGTLAFSDPIKQLGLNKEMSTMYSDVGDIATEHEKRVSKSLDSGMPVLKQHEIGMSQELAKKLPLVFKRSYGIDDDGIAYKKRSSEQVEGTMYDMLRYMEDLKEASKSMPDDSIKTDMMKHIQDDLVPYAESIRFPFTGVSSMQAFQPKLLKQVFDKNGVDVTAHAMAAPGMPDLDMRSLDEQIDKAKAIRATLFERREEEHLKPGGGSKDTIEALTETIRQLDKAISDVIPKYISHQQKLDHDGDTIQVHTGTMSDARKDIEKHFKSTTYSDTIDANNELYSTAAMWRDRFSYDARQFATGDRPMVDMAESFEKKFPREKGFSYYKRPFATSDDEFIPVEEQLSVLAKQFGRPGMEEFGVLSNIIEENIRGDAGLVNELIEHLEKQPMRKVDENLGEYVETSAEYGKRLLDSLSAFDSRSVPSIGGGKISDFVKGSIKERMSEEKMMDALEANLFKIHTGPETEALTRIGRIAEDRVGLDAGIYGSTPGSFKPKPEFAKRWSTDLASLGNKPEAEFLVAMNELTRFGIQKGMDVKHAGERPLASEIVKQLTRGETGFDILMSNIDSDSSYKELKEFANTKDEAIRNRLGEMGTEDLRKEISLLYSGRGINKKTAEINDMSRSELMSGIVDMAGFKGFVKELQMSIKEAAIKGLLDRASTTDPSQYSTLPKLGKGEKPDEAWARRIIESEESNNGINILSHVTRNLTPLYAARTSGATADSMLYNYRKRGLMIEDQPVSVSTDDERAIKGAKERKSKIIATSRTLSNMTSKDPGAMGGAYSDMVTSSIENDYETINAMESFLERVSKTGYTVRGEDAPYGEHMAGSAHKLAPVNDKFFALSPDVFGGNKMKELNMELEKYANIAGVPRINDADASAIGDEIAESQASLADTIARRRLASKPDATDEDMRAEYNAVMDSFKEKAVALEQIDRIVKAMSVKLGTTGSIPAMYADKTLHGKPDIVPPPYSLTASKEDKAKLRSVLESFGSDAPGEKAQYMNESRIMEDLKSSGGSYTYSSGVRSDVVSIDGCVPVTNCGGPLQVEVVNLSEGMSFRGGSNISTAAGIRSYAERPDKDTMAFMRDVANRMSSRANDPSEADTTYENVYRASGLYGGGVYKDRHNIGDKSYRSRSQVQGIMESMLGISDVSTKLDASAMMGTALHESVGAKLKEDMAKAGKSVELEKLINVDDTVAGSLTGHIDAIVRKSGGTNRDIEKVIDFKTKSTRAKDELSKLADKSGEVAYSDVLGSKDISESTKQAMMSAVSQVNLYLQALKELYDLSDREMKGITGEVHVFDAKMGGTDSPVKVKTSYDPDLYKRDTEAVGKARELIKRYGAMDPYNMTIDDEDKEYANVIKEVLGKTGGKPEFAKAKSFDKLDEDYRRKLAGNPAYNVSKDEAEKFARAAKAYYDYSKVTSNMTPPDRYMKGEFDREAYGPSEKTQFDEYKRSSDSAKAMLDRYLTPDRISKGEGITSVYKNLKTLHEDSEAYQKTKGYDLDEYIKSDTTNEYVSQHLESMTQKGPHPQEFIRVLEKLKSLPKDDGGISDEEVFKAWKLYRIAVGRFFVNEMEKAKANSDQIISQGGSPANAGKELYDSISQMQNYITRNIGSQTDIYTDDKRYLYPGLAAAAGVYLSPDQIIKKSEAPLGDDEQLRKAFTGIIEDTRGPSKNMTAPIDKARGVLTSISDMDSEAAKLLTDAESLKRIGPEVVEAWDFSAVVDKISRLRMATHKYLKYNLTEDFDSTKRENIERTMKYLKDIEKMYTSLNMGSRPGSTEGWGNMGIVKVPKWLDPAAQEAMHQRNLKKAEAYFNKSAESGGAKPDDRFTYQEKVFGETGEVIKNISHDFKKYGDYVDDAGNKVGGFTHKQRDLVESLQGANKTLGAAVVRAVKWGAASSIVYGGFKAIKESIATFGDIETGMAELKMVMNPNTDFGSMEKSATKMSKQYGTNMVKVLGSMKVFAQQGLDQTEVVERANVSLLAGNVTTLSAAEATEALTAAMKVFTKEGENAMRFMDAWSEVESKHAITAGDLANAIKKVGSAASSAGVEFDQLNAMVTAIGSVTRQPGKEIGTSLRFILRRLSSEKGPKSLSELPSPVSVMDNAGNLRGGFDVLNDVADQWDRLTNAQKLNVAQAIGGTRQYNSVLVLLNNWKEALDAVTHSENSKGSAERKNAIIMDTYQKQLERTKAAAVELQMQFGRIALPAFKTGLSGMTKVLEVFSAIPGPIKAAGIAITALLAYMAKGADMIDSLSDSFRSGKSVIGDFGAAVVKELGMAKYEVFGKGTPNDKGFLGTLSRTFGASDVKTDFLKTMALSPIVPSNRNMSKIGAAGDGETGFGLKQYSKGTKLSDFHSALGKTAFILKSVGDTFNKEVAEIPAKLGDIGAYTGEKMQNAGETLSLLAGLGGGAALFEKGGLAKSGGVSGRLKTVAASHGLGAEDVSKLLKGGGKGLLKVGGRALGMAASVGTEVAGMGLKGTGLLTEYVGEKAGAGGRKLMEEFAAENAGLVKSIAPMALTIAAAVPAGKALYGYFKDLNTSAAQFEKNMYAAKVDSEDELKNVKALSYDYQGMQKDLKKANLATGITEDGKEYIKSTKAVGTYESSLLRLEKLKEKGVNFSNKLAKTNVNMVAGYDKFGNAILKTDDNFSGLLSSMEKAATKKVADQEVKVAVKYVEELTQLEGPEKWKKVLKDITEEIPVIGQMLSESIHQGPGKAIDDITKDLNKFITAKSKAPMTTVFDKDIADRQEALKKIKEEYDASYKGFKKSLAGITTTGLGNEEIARLFSNKDLQKGYELMIKLDPKFNLPATAGKVDWKDVMGSQVLKRLKDSYGNVIGSSMIDATADLTEARITAGTEVGGLGISPRTKDKSGRVSLRSRDIVTFDQDMAKSMNIAGSQAIVEAREGIDGTFDWVAKYFNTKTLQVEEASLNDESIQKMVDKVFPAQQISERLEERVDIFNDQVAGIEAGLHSVQSTKEDINLGSRFFGDVATTDILKSNVGFNPMASGVAAYGASPYQKGWRETTDKFYLKPLADYKSKLEDYSKMSLGDLEGDESMLSGYYEEMKKLQEVLKNNQVVLQLRSVFVDLTKTLEQSARAAEENVAIEKSRLEIQKHTTGHLKGISKGLENVDTGVVPYSELNTKQRLVMGNASYRDLATKASLSDIRRDGIESNIYAADRSMLAIKNITEVARGLKTSISPEDMKNYTQMVAKTGDVSAAELNITTGKVVDNTAQTVDRLDSLLDIMGNEDAAVNKSRKLADQDFSGAGRVSMTNTIEKLAEIRDRQLDLGNQNGLSAANAAIDKVVKQYVNKFGLEAAKSMVDMVPRLSKDFSSMELVHRAFGGMDVEEVLNRMSGSIDKDKLKEFEGLRNQLKVYKEQDAEGNAPFIEAKDIAKASAALAVTQSFNKSTSSAIVASMEEKLKSIELEISKESSNPNAKKSKVESLTKEAAAVKQAIETEKGMHEFYSTVQKYATIGTASTALAKTMGMSENSIKLAGAAALTVYAGFKSAASATGEELPESVKKFEDELKKAAEKYAEGEGLSTRDKYKLSKAAKGMQSDYEKGLKDHGVERTTDQHDYMFNTKLKSQMYEASKAEVESFEKSSELNKKYSDLRKKQFDEMFAATKGGSVDFSGLTEKQKLERERFFDKEGISRTDRDRIMKEYPMDNKKDQLPDTPYEHEVKQLYASDIDKMSRDIQDRTRMTADNDPLARAASATAAATFTGYAISRNDEETRITTLSNRAQRQAEVFAEIIEKYPEAADKVLQEAIKETAAIEKAAAFKPEMVEESLLLDSEKEASKVTDDIKTIKERFIEQLNAVNEEAAAAKEEMVKLEIAQTFKDKISDMNKAVKDLDLESSIQDKLRGMYGKSKSFGLMKGVYSPDKIDYGVTSKSELTREQLLALSSSSAAASMKSVAIDESKVQLLVSSLTEAEKRRSELVTQKGTVGLTSAEDEELSQLNSMIDGLTDSISDLVDNINKSKDKLNPELIAADIKKISLGTELQKIIDTTTRGTARGIRGTGVFSSAYNMESSGADIGPRYTKDMSSYQILRLNAVRNGKTAVFDEYDQLSDKAAALRSQLDTAVRNRSDAEQSGDTEAVEQYQALINNTSTELNEVNTRLNSFGEAILGAQDKLDIYRQLQDEAINSIARVSKTLREASFGDPLNRGFGGFAGEVGVSSRWRDKTAQQQIWLSGGTDIQRSMVQAKLMSDRIAELRNGVLDKTSQAINLQRNIEDPNATAESIKSATDQLAILNDEMAKDTQTIDAMTQSMQKIAPAMSDLQDFTKAIGELDTALKQSSVNELVSRMPGVNKYDTTVSMFPGGSHPLAQVPISAEEAREDVTGLLTGKLYTDKYTLEEAKLRKSLSEATDYKERQNIYDRLRDLPNQKERDITDYKQREENEFYKNRTQNYRSQLSSMVDLERNGEFGPEGREAISGYLGLLEEKLAGSGTPITQADARKNLNDAMAKAKLNTKSESELKTLDKLYSEESARIDKGGALQYRDITMLDDYELKRKQAEVSSVLGDKFKSEVDKSNFSPEQLRLNDVVTQPIKGAIEEQTRALLGVGGKTGTEVQSTHAPTSVSPSTPAGVNAHVPSTVSTQQSGKLPELSVPELKSPSSATSTPPTKSGLFGGIMDSISGGITSADYRLHDASNFLRDKRKELLLTSPDNSLFANASSILGQTALAVPETATKSLGLLTSTIKKGGYAHQLYGGVKDYLGENGGVTGALGIAGSYWGNALGVKEHVDYKTRLSDELFNTVPAAALATMYGPTITKHVTDFSSTGADLLMNSKPVSPIDVAAAVGTFVKDTFSAISDSGAGSLPKAAIDSIKAGEMDVPAALLSGALTGTASPVSRAASATGLLPRGVFGATSAIARADSSLSDVATEHDEEEKRRRMLAGYTFANGGLATGYISGPGTGTSDSIFTSARPGSFILKASSTSSIGKDKLDELLKGVSGMSTGGQLPLYVSNGEYAVEPAAASRVGYGTLSYMNKYGKLPVGGFASGGYVDPLKDDEARNIEGTSIYEVKKNGMRYFTDAFTTDGSTKVVAPISLPEIPYTDKGSSGLLKDLQTLSANQNEAGKSYAKFSQMFKNTANGNIPMMSGRPGSWGIATAIDTQNRTADTDMSYKTAAFEFTGQSQRVLETSPKLKNESMLNNPEYMSARKQQEGMRKALLENIFNESPVVIAEVIGNDVARLVEQYRDIQKILANESLIPGFAPVSVGGKVDPKKMGVLKTKLHSQMRMIELLIDRVRAGHHLMGNEAQDVLKRMRVNEMDPMIAGILGDRDFYMAALSNETGLSDPEFSAFKNPELFDRFREALNNGPAANETDNEYRSRLRSMRSILQVEDIPTLEKNKSALEAAGKQNTREYNELASRLESERRWRSIMTNAWTPEQVSTTDLKSRDLYIKDAAEEEVYLRKLKERFGMRSGGVLTNLLISNGLDISRQSLPVYHSGGYVRDTGPAFLQRGEFVVPKLAAGGEVSGLEKFDPQSKGVVDNLKLIAELDSSKFESAISKLSEIELKVEDKKLQVEDVKIKVDTSEKVKVDTSELLKVDTSTLLKVDTSTPIPVDTSVLLKVDTSTPLPVDTSVLLKVDTSTPVSVDTSVPLKVDTSQLLKVDTSQLLKVDTSQLLKVDTSQLLKVDTSVPLRVEDKMFRLEDTTVKLDASVVRVDASSAAAEISNAIQSALSNAKIAVTGSGAVGSDKLDSLSEAITQVQNKLFTKTREIEIRLDELSSDIPDGVTIMRDVTAKLNDVSSFSETQINKVGSSVSELSSRIDRDRTYFDLNIAEVIRSINELKTISMRGSL